MLCLLALAGCDAKHTDVPAIAIPAVPLIENAIRQVAPLATSPNVDISLVQRLAW